MCCAKKTKERNEEKKEEPGVAGSAFDGGWGTRWWWDAGRGAENEGWAVGVGENRNVGVHGDVKVCRSGCGMLNDGWNFSWDDCRVSDEEDTKVGEVMSLVGLVNDIWLKVVLSGEENTWRKGGDADNVWKFGGAVKRIKQKILKFRVEGSCCGWQWMRWRCLESVSSDGRFDLGREDRVGDIINDNCDKHDDDKCDDDGGDNTSCNVSIINLKNLMFPFSVRWRWSL